MTILTLTEASRATGVARSTLYGYIQRGKLSVTSHPKGGRGVDTVELQRVFGSLKQTEAPKDTSVKSADTAEKASAAKKASPVKKASMAKKASTTKKTKTITKKVDVSRERDEAKRDEAIGLLHQQVRVLQQELADVKEKLEILEQRSLKPPKPKRRKGKKKSR